MAATACNWARSAGRLVNLSSDMPAPTAPELTSTHLMSSFEQGMQLVRQAFDLLVVEASVGVGQDPSADFDDNQRGGRGDLLPQQVCHGHSHDLCLTRGLKSSSGPRRSGGVALPAGPALRGSVEETFRTRLE